MHKILRIKKINTIAAIIVVGRGQEEKGQIIICSDLKIKVSRVKNSETDIVVKIMEEKLKKKQIMDMIKINTCPSAKDAVKYRVEIIDAQNLKIILEN
ncbi:MAG: hypothetical protein WA063_02450 [Minisyncoccia bacterium]